MKTLIVYFTRTGTTKKFAEALGEKLGADVEQLSDPTDYSGVVGYMKAGRSAAKKALVEIGSLKHDPAQYELVLIGSPVWVGVCAPAVRTFIEKYQDKCAQVALFTTQGSSREQKIFNDLKGILKKEPVATEFFTTKEVRNYGFGEKMDGFLKRLNT